MMHDAHNTSHLKHARWMLLAMLAAAFALAIACGGSDSLESEAVLTADGVAADSALAKVSVTMMAGQTFTFDDYVAAGWKKSKQFPTDTVPESTDIWYGFFNRKDIEIRFYDSHEIASTSGAENAAAAIDQSFREGGSIGASNRGAGSSAVTKYKAFAVVGNTVMLCELDVEACVALANALGG
ncbi:MAG: hypothetical protein IIB25_10775 [Chloroflexi bacterium]|nr:hypothetical protein [Chloroflexota bacterium]